MKLSGATLFKRRHRGYSYLTSTLYPLEVFEAVGQTASFSSGLLFPSLFNDNVNQSASLQNIVLTETTAYKSYDNGRDTVAQSANIQDMVLTVTTAYKSYDNGTDAVIQSANILAMSLTLTTDYVDYDNGTESVTQSANIIGMTLT